VAGVLILRWGASAYDSLGGLLDLAGRELVAEGYAVDMVRVDTPDWPKLVEAKVKQGGIDFALTMSGVGSDVRTSERKLVWDAWKLPLFNWCCDHPCYFPSRHGIRSPYLLHGYVFPDHARYNVKHLNPNGMAFTAHLAMPPRAVFGAAPLPLASRNGRIVFSKSGHDTNAIEASWRAAVPMMRDMLFAAAEALFHRSTADFVPVFQRLGERHGILLDGNNALTLNLIREVDAYIRYRRGNLVLRSLLGFPVDVYGRGWDHIAWDGAAARYHGVSPWNEAVRTLPSYLGCLSINPLIDESVHDRVFWAVAAGVAPCTDANGFSRAQMPELAAYTFDFTPEAIVAAAEALLADPRAALERTETTYAALSGEFTLRHAIRRIAGFQPFHRANGRVAA